MNVTLGDTLTFTCLTRNPSNGELTDADAVPTYRIYEGEAILGDAVATGSMAKLDDTNTVGLYSEATACSAANGFEASKSYTIYITYAVAGGGSLNGEIQSLKVWAADTNIAGAGDYEVALTIRTTGGTAISGVSVWLNTASDRSGAVAGPLSTDDAGLVTFNLSYTAYNIYCHLAGYTFANATMTPAGGSVTFTKDIGTAAVVGGDTGYSDSFLSRCIAKVRQWIDEPAINAKYTDTEIVEQLEFSYISVLAEKNRNAQTPAFAKITMSMSPGVTEYILPYTVGSIEAIYQSAEYGGKLFYSSRSKYNPFGQGLYVESNVIKLQDAALFGPTQEITVEYTPSGTSRLHHGTCTLGSDGTTAVFGASPNVGVLDTHHNAYTGTMFRLLNVDGSTVTGNYMQERPIVEYDNETRTATFSPVLSPVATTDDGSIYYEIAPAVHKGLDLVVAIHAAYTIAAMEGNRKRAGTILTNYREAIRNVRLSAYYSNVQECSKMRGDNFDNRFYGPGYYGVY